MLMWGGERERAGGAGGRWNQGAMVFLPKISAFICFLLPDGNQGCKIDAIKHLPAERSRERHEANIASVRMTAAAPTMGAGADNGRLPPGVAIASHASGL